MPTATAFFSPALFTFLRELRENNDRDWFQRSRRRYEADVRDPALRFVEAAGPRLRDLSEHLVADARPVGGSLFRIHRDVRFSKDKSPYKTGVGIHFSHDAGRGLAAPGLYLHLEPDGCFAAGGVHAPDPPTLTRIRDAIAGDTAGWERVVTDPAFAPLRGEEGDMLKRAPKGYDPAHPFVDDLRRKSHTWQERFDEAEVCAPGFLDDYVECCRAADGFHRFLAGALGVPW